MVRENEQFRCYYQNIGGLRTKLEDLKSAVLLCDFSVIILVETWLNDTFLSGEVNFDGYNTYRMDRCEATSCKSRGGGVLIAISSRLCSKEVVTSCNSVEQVYVEVKLVKKSVILGGVYIPPNSPSETYDLHCMTTHEILESNPDSELLIFGDYNLPDAAWMSGDGDLSVRCPENSHALNLAQEFAFLNMFQCNNIPNSRDVFLDLCFSTIPDVKVVVAEDLLLPDSIHHYAYYFEVQARCDSLTTDQVYLDFNNADYEAINSYLSSCNWDECFADVGVDGALDILYLALNDCMEFFVPKKRIKHSNFPKWFSPYLKDLVCKKKAAHKKFMHTNEHNDYIAFSHIRSLCKSEYKSCHDLFLQHTEHSLLDDPRYFWKYISNLRKGNNMPNNMYLNDRVSESERDIAELFACHFSNVYDSSDCQVPMFNINTGTVVNIDNFSVSEVFSKIWSIPFKNCCGPDGISNTFIKRCVCTLSKPLQLIFNKSLETGLFPTVWKHSYVVPIFKSGVASNVSNYRGVCIQSSMAKLFDSLVYDQLNWQCSSLISDRQFGFCRGKSTVENLASYQVALLEALESGKQVDAVYTDFSRAFDRVNFKILIAKLSALGFSDKLISWMKSFLLGRTQAVRFKGYVSTVFGVTSGVPQGSHCAPLLFLLFVNDITERMSSSKCLMFADDLKLYKVISSEADALGLQADLDALWQWTQVHNLFLNVSKCFFISFFRTNHRAPTAYLLNGVNLKYNVLAKDLGILFDERLTFSEHIAEMVMRGMKMLGFVTRNCKFFSMTTSRVLYASLVRSVLEYASVVWSPFYQVYKDRIERVQDKFLRFAAFKMNINMINYHRDDIGNALSLSSLEQRRVMADVCFIFKLVNGNANCPELLERIRLNIPTRGLRRHNLFYIPFHTTNYGLHSPIDRTLRFINSNPDLPDIFGLSLSGFKRSLRHCAMLF